MCVCVCVCVCVCAHLTHEMLCYLYKIIYIYIYCILPHLTLAMQLLKGQLVWSTLGLKVRQLRLKLHNGAKCSKMSTKIFEEEECL